MLRPKRIHRRNLIPPKNSCGSKIPHPPPPITLIGLILMQDQSKPPMFEGGIVFLKLKVLFKPSPTLRTFCTVIGSLISRTYLVPQNWIKQVGKLN